MMINGRAARPRARHRHLPAAHAQVQRRRPRSPSSRGGPPAFPIIKDLVVDRSAFDRIIEAGGYITAPHRRRARRQPDPDAEGGRRRGDGRGRVHRLRRVRGRVPERRRAAVHRGEGRAPQPAAAGPARALRRASVDMVEAMESYFGSCTNHGECEKACPKEIRIDFIALLNRDYVKAQFKNRKLAGQTALAVSGRVHSHPRRLRRERLEVGDDAVDVGLGAGDAAAAELDQLAGPLHPGRRARRRRGRRARAPRGCRRARAWRRRSRSRRSLVTPAVSSGA